MGILLPAALSTKVGPYAAVILTGFAIGIFGHVIKSRLLILTGILIVGLLSAYFAFVVGKLS